LHAGSAAKAKGPGGGVFDSADRFVFVGIYGHTWELRKRAGEAAAAE